jgi:hypothetical protein
MDDFSWDSCAVQTALKMVSIQQGIYTCIILVKSKENIGLCGAYFKEMEVIDNLLCG